MTSIRKRYSKTCACLGINQRQVVIRMIDCDAKRLRHNYRVMHASLNIKLAKSRHNTIT